MNAQNTTLDQIKSAMRLSDYVNQFTISPLKETGGKGKFMGFCPLHDNTNSPAFSVNDDKGVWHCFSNCGGGSIFDFWIIQHGYDSHDKSAFSLAVQGLAEELGVELPEYKSEKKEISPTRIKDTLDRVSIAATNYLFDSEDEGAEKAYDYLSGRGVTDEIIKKYRIGFLPDTNKVATKLITKAAGDDYSTRAAVAGGVLGESDGSHYTSLYGRIIIPITDRFGAVLGFGAREVPGVSHYGEGKWVNPTTTSVYDKSKILFDGGELSRNKKPSSVVICEGYFDAIAITESESNAIGLAVCGTATTPHHLEMLNSADEITFMFDGDDAGMNATSKLTWAINKREDLYAVILRDDNDPFDIVFKKNSDITISDLVEAAKPLLSVAIDIERERKTKNDDFDMWVANAISSIESDSNKNELAALAAKKRGQNRSAYIRNLSRVNVSKSIKYAEGATSVIDANSAALISFVMLLSDDEKDALFYNLDDEDVLDVLSHWLQVSSETALATMTAVLFGEPINKTEMSKTDIDREINGLLTHEDTVDITRPLKSILALISANSRQIIATGRLSKANIKRLVGVRELLVMAENVEYHKNLLALTIDLAIDVARIKEEIEKKNDD